jgi:low temperature requirement protein LtrA
MAAPAQIRTIKHGLQAMQGRDPHDPHRVATPLELLFDLAFVVAFSVAGSEFAQLLADGHYLSGLLAFGFAMFAVPWAWVNFTWFASAYDTDDWVYRLTTMVQMMGVIVLALGLPEIFASLDASLSDGPGHGDPLDARAGVIGYVIMRVPMMSQWIRAARQDPARSRSARTYAWSIVISQVLWLAWMFLRIPAIWMVAIAAVLMAFELVGPWRGEQVAGTPWHPHHVAERYGLLTIITLGEVVIGAVASLAAVIEHEGWTLDVAVLMVGGIGLVFGMWWIYFLLPAGEVLHHQREKSFRWGYGHIALFGPIAAVGAGLHVAALSIEGQANISRTAVMLTVAIPVAAYVLLLMALATVLIGRTPSAYGSLTVKLAVIALSVGLAAAGVSLVWCVVVVALAPAVSVIVHETRDAHHVRDVVAKVAERVEQALP